jgi:uncharacterized membrane protein YvbJ
MNDNQAICLNCGVKTGEGSAFCSNCGGAVAPGAEVCMNCGVAIKKAAAAGSIDKDNKVLMAVVCFFLGYLGIHNFMLGETKKGIVKIVASFCLVGLGGLLALIDFIKILMDKYVVDPEKFF